VTPKLPSWPAPLQALALVASPKLGLRQMQYMKIQVWLVSKYMYVNISLFKHIIK
jgi:hypothetical protein